MSNEYIFFDGSLCDRFVAFAASRGIAGKVRTDAIAGQVVELPDDLADDIDDEIEAEYEVLLAEQRDILDAASAGDSRSLMGVDVSSPDGRPLTVRLPAAYARRLMEHFTTEEIHELVTLIVANALDPVDGPLCHRAPDSP